MDLFWILIIVAIWMLFSLVSSVVQRVRQELSGSPRRRKSPRTRDSAAGRTAADGPSSRRTSAPSADDVLHEAKRKIEQDLQETRSVSTTRSLDSKEVLLQEEPRRRSTGRHPIGRLLSEKGHLDRDEVVFGVVMSEILRRPKCFRRRRSPGMWR